VRDALVVGFPDERLGEIPAAAVVWDPAEVQGLGEAEVLAQVIVRARALLAAYKVPRRWLVIDEIPLTPNGKPDRLGLTRLVAAGSRSTAEVTADRPAGPKGGTDGLRP
jgi:long-chain acyl-CoA synthetase